MSLDPLIKFSHVEKVFPNKDGQPRQVLRDVNLSIQEKSIFGIIGHSGAGKSTLIRCINGIEKPTGGTVSFSGKLVNTLKSSKLRSLRQNIGMIFQQFNLMPSRTVFENIMLPIKYRHINRAEARQKVTRLLEMVGLPDKASAFPSELSGGQKQRVAIARALIDDPKVLLCDEATSALDPQTTQDILTLLKDLNHRLGITLIIVTHEMEVIENTCDFVAVLDHGKIIEQGNVYSVFVNPKEILTQRFIATTSRLELPQEIIDSDLLNLTGKQKLVKITYLNGKAMVPLISFISRNFNVDANIVVGDIKILQQKPLGGLVIVLDGLESDIKKALDYLGKQEIRLEVQNYDKRN
ncbi:methionine ABC transporter ATP-binding protein [Lentilactobacillus parafarraginis]|uniref:ABC superfamily ATP binding cassette transporter, binding protein n=2 Tax=Lentilactobacillus parafarraginis TaxID=390842 RepID=A0A0R1YLJ0_9LACO|nr:methionine ABC transporter ATP-binding protein [Lentilactobacillus parafarraginis]KRM43344.1 ABC superfamily ATP binding cassette transporter, binding protein [Lentilactobacillus parafarraginis DSM 18390 = JCM 14109]